MAILANIVVRRTSTADRRPSSTGDADTAKTPRHRIVASQFLACMPKNLLLIDLGLALGFSTIIIPVLRNMQPERNPDELLRFSAEQSSWFGSLLYLAQPVGAIASGWITEAIGRKRAMLLSNVPHLFAWALLGCADSVVMVFVAGVLLSVGVGLMESSVITYVGEISDPGVRGVLLALANMCVLSGVFAMYVLGLVTQWRRAALVALAVPVATMVALCFVPETPYWLLAQRRPDDALRSLQWLRGWTRSAKEVRPEFDTLTAYVAHAGACDDCRRQRTRDPSASQQCTHSGYCSQLRDLLRRRTLRPFCTLTACMAVCMCMGNLAIRPFLVQLARTLQLPVDANWTTIIVGLMDILANAFTMVVVTLVGKRRLYLGTLAAAVAVLIGLSANAYFWVPAGVSSFDDAQTTAAASAIGENWTALMLVTLLAFLSSVVFGVPWSLISEVFPFRVRSTISGIAAAVSYFTMFVATKTYIDLECALGIWGTFALYAILSGLGFVLQYLVLPETEGHTLEEIELYFSDKQRGLTDRRIRSAAPQTPTANNEPATVAETRIA